jgi:hypothetical protein
MECGDFLPASISAEGRPPVAGRQLCLLVEFRRYASRSKENDGILVEISQFRVTGARPRDHANSAQCKALGGSAARQLGLAHNVGPREDVSRDRRGTIARCRLFPEPSRGSPQWRVRRGGIHQRPDALAFRAVEIESPIGERTDTWIRSPCRRRAWQALPLASSAPRRPWPQW